GGGEESASSDRRRSRIILRQPRHRRRSPSRDLASASKPHRPRLGSRVEPARAQPPHAADLLAARFAPRGSGGRALGGYRSTIAGAAGIGPSDRTVHRPRLRSLGASVLARRDIAGRAALLSGAWPGRYARSSRAGGARSRRTRRRPAGADPSGGRG